MRGYWKHSGLSSCRTLQPIRLWNHTRLRPMGQTTILNQSKENQAYQILIKPFNNCKNENKSILEHMARVARWYCEVHAIISNSTTIEKNQFSFTNNLIHCLTRLVQDQRIQFISLIRESDGICLLLFHFFFVRRSQCSRFLRTRLGELRSFWFSLVYTLYVCFSFVRVSQLWDHLEAIRLTISLFMNGLMPNMSIDLDMIVTSIFPISSSHTNCQRRLILDRQLRVNICFQPSLS